VGLVTYAVHSLAVVLTHGLHCMHVVWSVRPAGDRRAGRECRHKQKG
jgi:hypothetical protein